MLLCVRSSSTESRVFLQKEKIKLLDLAQWSYCNVKPYLFLGFSALGGDHGSSSDM